MEISKSDINLFVETVKEYSEYDFSDYSPNSLKRRLLKITDEYGKDIKPLIKTIQTDQLALEEIIKKITVNTTELFRDIGIWKSILYELLPKYKNEATLNIWHPGCSTGQEVYSMMIVLDQLDMLSKANIYASDINSDVMDSARQGSYRLRFNREYIDNFYSVFEEGRDQIASNSFFPMEKYMKIDEARDRISMNDFLKNKPVYEKIDLVKDDNRFFVNFDLIVCRNVIIYFNYDLQNRVLALFHRNMRQDGHLVLGLHESIIGPGTSLFEKTGHFYTRKKRHTPSTTW